MIKLVTLAINAFLMTQLSAYAQQGQFQRIRTFDPTTGNYVVPANAASPRYSQPATLIAPQSVEPAPVTKPIPAYAPARSNPDSATKFQDDDNTQPQDESSANGLAPISQPLTMPPDTLSRPPLPPANENVNLPQLSNPNIRPSLSWRSKAYKLSLESFDGAGNGKHPNLMMNGSVQDSLNALVQACQTNGLQIIGQSAPAGQLGARLNDATAGRSLFIFVLKKVGDDKTIVKASVEPDSKGKRLILLGDLLNQAASLVDGKGLL